MICIVRYDLVDEISKCDYLNETYRAVLFCGNVYILCNTVLTFESVDEILKCDHSNYESVNKKAVDEYIP